MTASDADPPPKDAPRPNPFSTRFIQPGAVAYLFEPESSADTLVERLREQQWWGEIIGPHGSGKSTLLAELQPELQAAGRHVSTFVCREGQRRLPIAADELRSWHAATQLVVDGYEQLGWFARWRLQRNCRRRGAGLLITAHQPMGLPTLLITRPTLESTRAVVQEILAAFERQFPTDERVTIPNDLLDRLYRQHRGNVRELLFGLYDWYESERRAKA